jgi:hypothetical protein
MEGPMWRPIAIAVGVMTLFALTFCIGATGENDAVTSLWKKSEYVVPSNPYLPIRRF